MWTSDLKAGYHQIPMSADMFQWLGFQIRSAVIGLNYLPFGVAPACHIYTQLMGAALLPITPYWPGTLPYRVAFP